MGWLRLGSVGGDFVRKVRHGRCRVRGPAGRAPCGPDSWRGFPSRGIFERHPSRHPVKPTPFHLLLCAALGPLLLAAPGWSAWPAWRGPFQNGSAPETGLVESWTPGGPGQVWKAAFTGRSTPVVLDGRVFVTGRVGRDVTEQEQIAAFDAATGELLWEDRFNVFHTTIPFNRVGWASPAADPRTGRIYVHGVQGLSALLHPRRRAAVGALPHRGVRPHLRVRRPRADPRRRRRPGDRQLPQQRLGGPRRAPGPLLRLRRGDGRGRLGLGPRRAPPRHDLLDPRGRRDRGRAAGRRRQRRRLGLRHAPGHGREALGVPAEPPRPERRRRGRRRPRLRQPRRGERRRQHHGARRLHRRARPGGRDRHPRAVALRRPVRVRLAGPGRRRPLRDRQLREPARPRRRQRTAALAPQPRHRGQGLPGGRPTASSTPPR